MNSCALSLVDDEEFETLQRVEQFRESDFEPMIAPRFDRFAQHEQGGAS